MCDFFINNDRKFFFVYVQDMLGYFYVQYNFDFESLKYIFG